MSRPSFSSGEPGSVTMTKWRPMSLIPASSKACQYARRCESVSTVDPDLLETTTTVRSSRSARAERTWCGSVVSSTVSGTPRVRVITSGASDEPPMPASTTWSSPASCSRRLARRGSSSRLARKVSTQPSRISASASASGPQRVGSFSASNPGTLASTSSCRALAAPGTWSPPRTASPAAASTSLTIAPQRLPAATQLRFNTLREFEVGGFELLHTFAFQGRDHVVVVDSQCGELVQNLLSVLVRGLDHADLDLAVVGEGVDDRL